MKVGIIRCLMTEDLCPGTMDFIVTSQGKGAFQDTGPVEVIGFVTCGGCPGKRAASRAKMLVERGAEAIVLASCISRGNPIGFPCPFYTTIRDVVMKAIGPEVPVIEWTH